MFSRRRFLSSAASAAMTMAAPSGQPAEVAAAAASDSMLQNMLNLLPMAAEAGVSAREGLGNQMNRLVLSSFPSYNKSDAAQAGEMSESLMTTTDFMARVFDGLTAAKRNGTPAAAAFARAEEAYRDELANRDREATSLLRQYLEKRTFAGEDDAIEATITHVRPHDGSPSYYRTFEPQQFIDACRKSKRQEFNPILSALDSSTATIKAEFHAACGSARLKERALRMIFDAQYGNNDTNFRGMFFSKNGNPLKAFFPDSESMQHTLPDGMQIREKLSQAIRFHMDSRMGTGNSAAEKPVIENFNRMIKQTVPDRSDLLVDPPQATHQAHTESSGTRHKSREKTTPLSATPKKSTVPEGVYVVPTTSDTYYLASHTVDTDADGKPVRESRDWKLRGTNWVEAMYPRKKDDGPSNPER